MLNVREGLIEEEGKGETMLIPLVLVLVVLGCCNKILETEWLKQQTVTSHTYGGWEGRFCVC